MDFALCLVLLHKKRYNIKTLTLQWWQDKAEKSADARAMERLGGIPVLFIAICDNNPAVIVELTRMLNSGFLKEDLRIVGCETKEELLL